MTARLLVLMTLGLSAHAAFADAENPCMITKDVVLTADSFATCDSLYIGPGVKVVTHQFKFTRLVNGMSQLGSVDNPAHVVCQAAGEAKDIDCGNITIDSFAPEGGWIADAKAPKGHASGEIAVAFHGYAAGNFKQKLTTAPGFCTVLRDGNLVPECAFGTLN